MRIALFKSEPDIALPHNTSSTTDIIASALAKAKHPYEIFHREKDLLSNLQRETFDAVIFAIGFQLNGLPLIKELNQKYPSLPLLMVSHNNSDEYKSKSLEAGIHNYLSTPSDSSVVAYIEALARLSRASSNRPLDRTNFGDYVFLPTCKKCHTPNGDVELTDKELLLALALFRDMPKYKSRNDLIKTVWQREVPSDSRTLDTHISRVRDKLSLKPESGYRISAVYGLGYRLERIPKEEINAQVNVDDEYSYLIGKTSNLDYEPAATAKNV